MTYWPVLDHEPVELPTHPDQSREMWEALLALSEVRPGEWTLVGGQMVFLHALEHSASAPRGFAQEAIKARAKRVEMCALEGFEHPLDVVRRALFERPLDDSDSNIHSCAQAR